MFFFFVSFHKQGRSHTNIIITTTIVDIYHLCNLLYFFLLITIIIVIIMSMMKSLFSGIRDRHSATGILHIKDSINIYVF